MGGLPRDACESLIEEVARLDAVARDLDADLAKAEAIIRRARARLRAAFARVCR